MEQRLEIGHLDRHRHNMAYAAIVLSGGYDEFGDSGRWHLTSGDVVTHRKFEAHGNSINRKGVVVLNLTLPDNVILPSVFTVADPDELIRLARSGETDLISALRPARVKFPKMEDWADELARSLQQGPVRLSDWARKRNLAPETLSRGFRSAFGTTAARYRTEMQAHQAIRCIRCDVSTLAEIALDCGFADQAHMSRSVFALTGQTPSSLRQIKSVQDFPRADG